MPRKYYRDHLTTTAQRIKIWYTCPNTKLKNSIEVGHGGWSGQVSRDWYGLDEVSVSAMCPLCKKYHRIEVTL